MGIRRINFTDAEVAFVDSMVSTYYPYKTTFKEFIRKCVQEKSMQFQNGKEHTLPYFNNIFGKGKTDNWRYYDGG